MCACMFATLCVCVAYVLHNYVLLCVYAGAHARVSLCVCVSVCESVRARACIRALQFDMRRKHVRPLVGNYLCPKEN